MFELLNPANTTVAVLGTNDIMIIGAIVFVLFGGAKLAQLGKGLGEGIREFKNSAGGSLPEVDRAIEKVTRTVDRIAPTVPAEQN